MELQTDLSNLTDTELVDLLDEHYFTLATTGGEAVSIVAWEVAQGTFAEAHGLDDARMGKVLVMFAKRMKDAWDTPAVAYYERNRFALMAGLINDITGRK